MAVTFRNINPTVRDRLQTASRSGRCKYVFPYYRLYGALVLLRHLDELNGVTTVKAWAYATIWLAWEPSRGSDMAHSLGTDELVG